MATRVMLIEGRIMRFKFEVGLGIRSEVRRNLGGFRVTRPHLVATSSPVSYGSHSSSAQRIGSLTSSIPSTLASSSFLLSYSRSFNTSHPTQNNSTSHSPTPTSRGHHAHVTAERPFDLPTSGPIASYWRLVDQKKIKPDGAQTPVLTHLQALHERLKGFNPPPPPPPSAPTSSSGGFFSRFLSRDESHATTQPIVAPKGLYLYGDVGCGKTFLMDLFFETAPVLRKRRAHFHDFMLDVHRRIHKWRTAQKRDPEDNDPIPPLARALVSEATLLCFDEFQVTDVADAMILHRLFREMFSFGLVIVATSNRIPNDLYKNGLQRNQFLPFIDLLYDRCLVHDMKSGIDYRLTGDRARKIFYTPLSPETSTAISSLFSELTHHKPIRSTVLQVDGRNIQIPKMARGVAWFTFQELCENPLGAADYIVIAEHFHTVIVTDIPRMTLLQKNEARRFIILIDALYELKVKFICSAETDPEKLFSGDQEGTIVLSSQATSGSTGGSSNSHLASLFSGDEEVFMFSRAVSRMIEMQSEQYLALPHRGKGPNTGDDH